MKPLPEVEASVATPSRLRRGFTMIELLIVIAVIALLLSLLTGAMFAMVVNAREAATAATIAKIDKILQERIAGFRMMDFTDAATQFQISWNINNSTQKIPSQQLAEVLVRKMRMKNAFPQNLSEVYSFPNGTAVINPRYSALSVLAPPTTVGIGGVANSYTPNAFEPGIVLYAMLMNGETFGAPSVTNDTFTSSEVQISTATSGLPCLVDGWGKPLRFYRWPTLLFKPNGLATTLPVDRTFATLLAPNIGRYAPYVGGSTSSPNPLQWYGTDGVPQPANGNCPYGAYGSDDIPNVGPDGAPGIAGVSPNAVTSLGVAGSDDYEPLNVDSDDPWLMLLNPSTVTGFLTGTTITTTIFQNGSAAAPVWPALHTPNTFHPYLILSAGADGLTGLFEPNDFANFGYLAEPNVTGGVATPTAQAMTDNITNLNLTGSGK